MLVDHSFIEHQAHLRLKAQRGEFVFHAACLHRDNHLIALTGPSGKGKSTLSVGLRKEGWTLLGDDTMTLVLKEDPPLVHAQALTPRLRLNPDSVRAVVDEPTVEIDSFGKHVFNLSEEQRLRPLEAVFVLGDGSEDAITARRLAPSEACFSFVANSFASDPHSISEAKVRFEKAVELAKRVPAYCLRYPRDFDALPEVAATISEVLNSLASADGTRVSD